MDSKTCEEYVLAKLADALAENERLKAELGKAKERLDAIEGAKPSALEQMVVEYGRRALFCDKTYARTTSATDDGEVKPYGTWCMEAMDTYRFPNSIDKTEFMAFFEPEFREEYEERLEEERCAKA